MKKYRLSNDPHQLLPTVSIAVNGNKLKVYDNNAVYLKNGTEFELFFENNTAFNYKAEIIINGEHEHSSLVLSPYQRFRLNRFMDTNKKMLFDVYEVDDNNVVKEIIKNNGNIIVKFYKEFSPIQWTISSQYYETFAPQSVYYNYKDNGSSAKDVLYNSTINAVNASLENNNNYITTTGMYVTCDSGESNFNSKQLLNDKIETGRVEEGNKSSQKFASVNMNFNSYYDVIVEYNLLPYSQKPNTSKTLRSYCTCGRRVRKNDKYCAGCGRKV